MKPHPSFVRSLIWLTMYAIAFGFVESTVVVYLRKIYYGDGFHFPLTIMDPHILVNEILREFATMVMLFAPGAFIARSAKERFAWFIYIFGVWDIFFYIWLKVLLDWPETLMVWDILFLIPIVWDGPVITPVICSLTMIGLASAIFYAENRNPDIHLRKREWLIIIAGSAIIIFSFCENYGRLLKESHSRQDMEFIVSHYVPHSFDWLLFATGEALVLSQTITFFLRAKKADPY